MKIEKILKTIGMLAVIGVSGTITYHLIKKYRNRNEAMENGLESDKPKNILLLGGLDNRNGDLSITEQVELLERGVSNSLNVEGFRYNDITGIINRINNSEKEMYVVLFSAGCSKSKDVAQELINKEYNLNYMFIVEPYGKSSTTSQSVKDAVSMGVPSKNVMVGNSQSTGLDIIDNATSTPSCSPTHWCSLIEIGEVIK